MFWTVPWVRRAERISQVPTKSYQRHRKISVQMTCRRLVSDLRDLAPLSSAAAVEAFEPTTVLYPICMSLKRRYVRFLSHIADLGEAPDQLEVMINRPSTINLTGDDRIADGAIPEAAIMAPGKLGMLSRAMMNASRVT